MPAFFYFDFIARACFRILELPETPQEFVGQHLLFGYLDQFVRQVRGFIVEVRKKGHCIQAAENLELFLNGWMARGGDGERRDGGSEYRMSNKE